MDFITKLLDENAPPNYKMWYDHSLQMIRLQYVEQYPELLGTPYGPDGQYTGMLAENYNYGDYITASVLVSSDFSVDERNHYTRVVVEGVDEDPRNDVENHAFASTPAGWSLNHSGPPTSQNLFDRKAQTDVYFSRNIDIRWDSPPAIGWETEQKTWYDFVTCDIGYLLSAPKTVQKIIIWGMYFSKRDFPCGLRLLVSPDNASWQPINEEYWDKEIKPRERLEITNMKVPSWRYLKVQMRPAKIGQEDLFGFGLADIFVLSNDTLTGEARITDSGSVVGDWTYVDDTLAEKYMPDIYKEILGPGISGTRYSNTGAVDKIVLPHKTLFHSDHSLTSEIDCTTRATHILDEALRITAHCSFQMAAHLGAQVFKTVKVTDARKNIDTYFMINDVTVDPKSVTVQATRFDTSDWLGEDI